jgi:hypothetical protein
MANSLSGPIVTGDRGPDPRPGYSRTHLASIVLIATTAFLAASPILSADDTNLGTWTGTTDKNGTKKDPADFGKDALWEVFENDKGEVYIRRPKTGPNDPVRSITPEPGSTTNYVKGNVAGASTQPAPAPGSPRDGFDMGIKGFIIDEISRLTPQTPGVGTSFYQLALTPSLEALGNNADLWGSLSPITSTDGVVGFDQVTGHLSVLGSSTADGLTPIRYDYDPTVTGLAFEFGGTQLLQVNFIAGDVYTPTTFSTDYVVTGRMVPEPSTLFLTLSGTAAAGIWLSRRRRVAEAEGPGRCRRRVPPAVGS